MAVAGAGVDMSRPLPKKQKKVPKTKKTYVTYEIFFAFELGIVLCSLWKIS
jgi:hypothetical protein